MGAVILATGLAALYKIFKGEKDPFAYLMTLLSCSYGVICILMGTADNISSYFVFLYISLELSVQGWLLSVHYIEVAIKSGETLK